MEKVNLDIRKKMQLQLKTLNYLLLTLFTVLMVGCEKSPITGNTEETCFINYPDETEDQITINQGVWGNVWYWDGDFQCFNPNGVIHPVVRDIHIFEGVTMDSAIQSERGLAFYSEINSKLIKITSSNTSGFFEAVLDIGTYSFFVIEDSHYYAGSGGGDPVLLQYANVFADSVTKRQINI